MVNWKQHDLERARTAAMVKEQQLRDLKALRERGVEHGKHGEYAVQVQVAAGEESKPGR